MKALLIEPVTHEALTIRAFEPGDRPAVIDLWRDCGLLRPWNDPRRDIERKLAEDPELFLVAERDGDLVGTAMVGYDGHRGWVYYFAVAAAHRRASIGRSLMFEAEARLLQRGCPKLNVLVRTSNAEVLEFYRKLGYVQDDVVGLGKRLIDDPPSEPHS